MAKVDGWVYVFTNAAMLDLVKIGYTMKDPAIRAEDLSKEKGIPMPFVVTYKTLVISPYDVEQAVHEDLESDRVNNQREFFRCNPIDAIECIREDADIKYEVCDEEYYEEGTYTWSNDDEYVGELKDHKLHGSCLLSVSWLMRTHHSMHVMVTNNGLKFSARV